MTAVLYVAFRLNLKLRSSPPRGMVEEPLALAAGPVVSASPGTLKHRLDSEALSGPSHL